MTIDRETLHLGILMIGGIFLVILETIRLIATIKNSTKEDNLKMIKSWLLSVIVNAEKIYGGKTGKVKLSYVYGLFIEKFPKLAKIVTFDTFSALVDEVLKIDENFINTNTNPYNITTNSAVVNKDNPYGVKTTLLSFNEEGQ
jgi:hypothetical protein